MTALQKRSKTNQKEPYNSQDATSGEGEQSTAGVCREEKNNWHPAQVNDTIMTCNTSHASKHDMRAKMPAINSGLSSLL
jgi:hypothetical protein